VQTYCIVLAEARLSWAGFREEEDTAGILPPAKVVITKAGTEFDR